MGTNQMHPGPQTTPCGKDEDAMRQGFSSQPARDMHVQAKLFVLNGWGRHPLRQVLEELMAGNQLEDPN